MAAQIPVQTWGRLISPNEDEVPAQLFGEMPATVSVTMAALDPGEEWSNNTDADKFKGKKPRATIKMIVYPSEDDESDEDEDDETDPDLAALLDEEADSDSDDNGEGPSDLTKARNARLAQELLGHSDADGKPKVNGVGKNKGKGKLLDGAAASDEEEEEDDEDEDMDEDMDLDSGIPDEYVLCTLDPDSVSLSSLYLRSLVLTRHGTALPAATQHHNLGERERVLPR